MQNLIVFSIFILVTTVSLAGQSQPQQKVQPITINPTTKSSEARTVISEAKAAALIIKEDFQRGLVLDKIGAAEATAGELNAAVETANRADPENMATLTAIGVQLANLKDKAKAQTIGAKLKGESSSTVFAFIVQGQAEKGNIAEALSITDMIQAPEVRGESLAGIAQHMAANGDYAGARKTLALARSAYPAQGPTPDGVEMTIAEGQLARGDQQAARATIAAVMSAQMRRAAMISGAEELFKNGDPAGSGTWLKEALEGLPPGLRFDFIRYMAIPLQVKLGQKEYAMQSAGALAPEFHVKGFTAVAVTCAEMKDVPCVNAAVEKIQSAGSSGYMDKNIADFDAKIKILDITAALIDNGEMDVASRLLGEVEQHVDEFDKLSIEREVKLQRVCMLAQQDRFDDSRSLALKMLPDSVADVQRGTALCAIAALQTQKNGIASSRQWAATLPDAEDRAYSLLGIAQALLEIEKVKLPYSAIFVH